MCYNSRQRIARLQIPSQFDWDRYYLCTGLTAVNTPQRPALCVLVRGCTTRGQLLTNLKVLWTSCS